MFPNRLTVQVLALLAATACVVGCGVDFGQPCSSCVVDPSSILPDCSNLSTKDGWFISVDMHWTTEPAGDGATRIAILQIGESREVSVGMAVGALACDVTSAISSVTWSVGDPAVASIQSVQPPKAWLTGIRQGETSLSARILFRDGIERMVTTQGASRGAAAFRVRPRDLPSGRVIVESTVSLDPYVSPGLSGSYRKEIRFATPSAGRLDVTVDWGFPTNNIDVVLFGGTCSPDCGLILNPADRMGRFKPLVFWVALYPSGDHLMRIDNLGSTLEVVHYEIRLTPES